jgi:hypothetical protein
LRCGETESSDSGLWLNAWERLDPVVRPAVGLNVLSWIISLKYIVFIQLGAILWSVFSARRRLFFMKVFTPR